MFNWFNNLLHDARRNLRTLSRSPGFVLIAVLSLGLCIGANAVIYSAVDTILVRSLPFPDSDRLVTVINSFPGAGMDRAESSIANYFDRRNEIKAFESVSIFQEGSSIVGEAGSTRRVVTALISPEFFKTLGVPLAQGRPFTDEELERGAEAAAILTDDFWRSHFNADPEIVGKTFQSDGLAISVVGVLPPGFRFLSSRAQIFRPAEVTPELRLPEARYRGGWKMIARLAPGATVAAAQVQVDALNERQLSTFEYADEIRKTGFHSSIRPLHEDHVQSVRSALLLLQGGVLILLVIGGVNLFNLLLIRASDREKELAIRRALGAGRRQLAQEILVETMLLALGGGLIGLLIGSAGVRLLATLGVDQLPLGASIRFDWRLATISLIASLLVGPILAAPIIWYHLRTKLAIRLKNESRGATSGHAVQRLRHGFIVAQIALAFTLLTGASVLGLSLKHALETPLGFQTENRLTGKLILSQKQYANREARAVFVNRLLPALRALPGVEHAAINTGLPFSGWATALAVGVEGHVPARDKSKFRAHYQFGIAGEYWQAMGIPLIEGRLLDEADNQLKHRVCVVDQTFARHYWPDSSALGRRIAYDGEFDEESYFTVVGVVGDVKQHKPDEAGNMGATYVPYTQYETMGSFSMIVRAALPPAVLAPLVNNAVRKMDPQLMVEDMESMQARMDDSLVTRRSPAILAAIFAGFALLLATIGIYGVMAYTVTQRTCEFGIRMALGAQQRDVLNLVFRQGIRLIAIGLAIGVAGALLLTGAMRSLLYDVSPGDPLTLTAVGSLLAFVAVIACWLPARRAARLDPMTALRAE